MPLSTPFHPRTSALATSNAWKEWAGYHAVCSFDTYIEREYFAFRHAAGLIDVTPLYKYEVRGRDAGRFLSYVTVKDVTQLAPGRVTYLCWCDVDGKVLDDGTITRWDDDHYRLTSADPSYGWLLRHTRGFDVEIEDVSAKIGALSLQGPNALAILDDVCDDAISELRFFRGTRTRLAGKDVEVTRTGYTGDLGYEIWMPNESALPVWDALIEAGVPYGMEPAGLDAMDITRVEAGFILGGVDYTSARNAIIENQKSSPREIGLGWCVDLERDPFIGQRGLLRERETGPAITIGMLELDWDELEAHYEAAGLPPNLPSGGWRESIPVYDGGVQVGYGTSGAWSPTMKRNLALATLDIAHSKIGTELRMEVTVYHERKTVKATVVKRPLFDPARKRQNFAARGSAS
jgi:aminomethyltransferase